jgi:CheY-like chemotaxis protein
MRTWPTALVVDDHEGFRAFARLILESAGFTVTEAATGAEAASAAAATSPQLVLLDIQLPDTDGFEVARQLTAAYGQAEDRQDRQDRQGWSARPGPVIVLTSTREASDYGGRIAASPAAGFLPKDQLSALALRGYLDGDRNGEPP